MKKPPANKPTTPVSVDPVEMIDAELNEEFRQARANVDATADAAQAAIERHNAARTIFEYVGSKIRDQYGLGDLARVTCGLGDAERLHNGNHAMVGQPGNGGCPQLGQ